MYYLIEHNRTSKNTKCWEYPNYADAQTAGLEKEQEHLFDDSHEMEVVVFEANSIDDLKRTHSRYFIDGEKDNGAGAGVVLAAVGLVGLAVYLLNKKE